MEYKLSGVHIQNTKKKNLHSGTILSGTYDFIQMPLSSSW